ncbi:MAG: hypothetical protein Q4D80_03445 [Pseudomonadota bacterium]|nr:hypothetical protein [Pseudomonadota bacterium]
MLEITKQFQKTKIITTLAADIKLSLEKYRRFITFNSYKILGDANLRFSVTYNMEALIKKHFGQKMTMIVALDTGILPFAVLLCQNNSLYSDLPIVCIPTSNPDNMMAGPSVLTNISFNHKKILLMTDICDKEQPLSQAIDVLQNNGNEILGVVSLFSFDRPQTLNFFKEKKIDFLSLSRATELTIPD